MDDDAGSVPGKTKFYRWLFFSTREDIDNIRAEKDKAPPGVLVSLLNLHVESWEKLGAEDGDVDKDANISQMASDLIDNAATIAAMLGPERVEQLIEGLRKKKGKKK